MDTTQKTISNPYNIQGFLTIMFGMFFSLNMVLKAGRSLLISSLKRLWYVDSFF